MDKNLSLEYIKSGKTIYGDNFSQEEIAKWFADEAEGYAGIVPEEHKDSFNEYEMVTEATLYRYFRKYEKRNWKILSYGGVWH